MRLKIDQFKTFNVYTSTTPPTSYPPLPILNLNFIQYTLSFQNAFRYGMYLCFLFSLGL